MVGFVFPLEISALAEDLKSLSNPGIPLRYCSHTQVAILEVPVNVNDRSCFAELFASIRGMTSTRWPTGLSLHNEFISDEEETQTIDFLQAELGCIETRGRKAVSPFSGTRSELHIDTFWIHFRLQDYGY